jgi:hypothetical protein
MQKVEVIQRWYKLYLFLGQRVLLLWVIYFLIIQKSNIMEKEELEKGIDKSDGGTTNLPAERSNNAGDTPQPPEGAGLLSYFTFTCLYLVNDKSSLKLLQPKIVSLHSKTMVRMV